MRLVHYLRINFCSGKSQRKREKRKKNRRRRRRRKGKILGINCSWAGNFYENRAWINSGKLD